MVGWGGTLAGGGGGRGNLEKKLFGTSNLSSPRITTPKLELFMDKLETSDLSSLVPLPQNWNFLWRS